MDNNQNEIIKTFLKIESPNFQDKPYYSINKEKNILTIFDPVDKGPSDKSSDFEQDKIFIENDGNSYIYEEICKNTIKESLEGISFSFISYGDSNSNKIKLLIGDIKDNNLNHDNIGIFPKLLENLIKKMKSHKNSKGKINLQASYFLVYDGDMIDLSNLKNIKDIKNFSEEKLFEGKYNIKNEENIIDIIKKENIESFKEEIHFINNIFYLLSDLEEKGENKNVFTRSHICIIIYIENELNKKNSIINFVLLNGSEYLYSGRANQFKSISNNDNNIKLNKNTIEGTKIALETQYTYETLLNLIKLKIYIDNNIEASNSKQIKLILKKNNQNSKLTTLLYNLFFKIQKMNFRIIGTVIPNIGFYQSFKDTLIFLFDFYKLKKANEKQLSSSININIDNNAKIKDKDKSVQHNNNYEKHYEDIQKDNLIFDLQNKVNTYKRTILEQKENLSKKEEKIAFLSQNYQQQINILKKKFNFTGDINVLLSGDENTKEAKFIRNLRDASEANIRNEGNLRILQKKLESQEEELKKLKNKEQMIDSNDTMIKYYISVQQINEEKNKKDKDVNHLKNIIEDLNKKIKIKDEIIDKFKDEIQNKNKILFNLPKCLKDSYTNLPDETKSKTNRESNLGEQNLQEENNYEKNESMQTDNLYRQEIEKIKKDNQKKLDIMKLNYENLLKDKNDIIKKLEHNYEILKQEINKNINKYGNEIIKLNKILMSLISNYKRIYFSNITEKISIYNFNQKKDEFDKIILNIDKDINCNNFPLLYKILLKTNQLKMNQPLLYINYKKIYEPIKKVEKVDEEEKIKTKNDEKVKVKENIIENDLKSKIPIKEEKLNQFFKEETNNGKIIFTKETLEEMSKESIILHCININNKLIGIEKYLQKYTEYKKGFNVEQFELGEKYKDQIIKELKDKINKLSIKLEEQMKINNKNICVINSQNRKVDKLEKETIVYNNLLKYKKPSSSIITPNKSTIYNSSAIEFNSLNSNNNSISKNTKSLKKSSSYININNRHPFSPKIRNKYQNNSNDISNRPISPKIKDFAFKKMKNKLYMA